jgi:rhamnogalacturonan endolyase
MKSLLTGLATLFLLLTAALSAAASEKVTLKETAASYTLANGIVTVTVAKSSGDLSSLKFKGLEMLDASSGQKAAYWSHNAARSQEVTRITIDPKSNGGDRAEVSVKGISGGSQLGSGPGGSVIADVEIRYALGRGDSGVYTYSIFTHPTNYPATSVGEARFCAKLNDDLFDWMTVDARRNMQMISTYDWNHGTQLNMKEVRRMNSGFDQGQVEHKYDYSANQFEVRAWGWSSTARQVGLWFVNPSVEYLSGGPTKYELSSHRDATFNTNNLDAPAPPTLLNYWRGSHYGGSICNIAQTDAWTKVIGPFLIYCNAGSDHNGLWKDALAKVKKETKAWPYDWVAGVDYPHKNERATVTGRLVLHDPEFPRAGMSNILVGLTAPDYAPPVMPRTRNGFAGFGPGGGGEDETNAAGTNIVFRRFGGGGNFTNRYAGYGFGRGTNGFGRFGTNGYARYGTNGFGRGRFGRGGGGGGGGGGGLPKVVDWQNDAKNYEFWVRADARGNFTIPKVRPGTYALHAIADGVLGDFSLSNAVTVTDQTLRLGKLTWEPVRHGRQLWDIGIPNRNASEFFKGDDYFHWGWYIEYAKLFPNDVTYVVGQSNFHKDWFFEQVPHNENPTNTTGNGQGASTTWSIAFNLPEAPKGKATLRLAICGVGTRTLAVMLNDQSIGRVTDLTYNATINRDGIGGYWKEHDLEFDAALMKAGENSLTLTIPGGGLANGLIYDYVRLELDDAPAPKPL